MKWMEACVFSSTLSILVNGSPTNDFLAEHGLRKGEPISPFLFVLVAEGLACLVNKVVILGKFVGFCVCNSTEHRIMQFADDTIIIGKANWENAWSIKAALRGFEMVYELKFNFLKRKLYGVHVKDEFLVDASHFLSCNVDAIHFKFLGVLVGSNPRRRVTLNPLINYIKRMLLVWK